MKTILMLLPLTFALTACNQFSAQYSEFAAMGKGSIIESSESDPEVIVVTDGGSFGGTSGGTEPKDKVVVTDGGSFGGTSGGTEPKDEVVVTDGGSFGGTSGGTEPKDEVVVTDGGSFGGSSGGTEPKVEVVVTDGGSFGGTDGGVEPKKEETPVQKALCVEHGLQGTLWDASLLKKSPKFADAVKDGVLISSPIFLPQLDFFRDEHPGFKLSDSEYVLNQSGAVLKEKYGLELTADLTLSPDDEEGYYQIGYFGEDQFSVEVDGKTMAIPKNGFTQGPSTKFRYFIEQGQTLMQFKLERGKTYALKIQTSQNNKDDYAAVLLWRKVRNLNEPYRDLPQKQYSGNTANEDIKTIINEDSSGNKWSVLKNANYLLPDPQCNQ